MKTFCILSLLFGTFLVSNAQIIEKITPALGVQQLQQYTFTGGVAVYHLDQNGISQYTWGLNCPDAEGKSTHPKREQACKELEQFQGTLDSLATNNHPEVNAPGCPETDIQEFAALSIDGKSNGQEVKVMEVKYRNLCSLYTALTQAGLPDLVPIDQNGNLAAPLDAATA